ncbi:MAG: ribosomal L10 family protein [Candidatus Xenolissoclinum pacificiensis L6]|uniref:Large ribosomal subunit protein uL10 n=1 Tax=Candidatus Xenolissoclinum pacificiensis L6 TaxID=1401685 RepID=W2UZ26_9RICK|nr:MAG: ribosomal L10 family protein [Candidatus Xenolissoclinum pacificiensis L6]
MNVKKQKSVQLIGRVLRENSSLVVVGFSSLTVQQSFELHKSLWSINSNFMVVKNRLMKIVCDDINISIDDDAWKNANFLVYGNDLAMMFPVIYDYVSDHEGLVIKGIYHDGQIVSIDVCKSIVRYGGIDAWKYHIVFSAGIGSANRMLCLLRSPIVKLINILKVSSQVRGDD